MATLLRRISSLGAKVESTKGTAETITATEAVFNVYNVNIIPDITINRREGQTSLSQLAAIPGGRMGRITFETDLVGKGSSGRPDWASVFLSGCGFVDSTGTFSPTSNYSTQTSVTFAHYINGKRFLISGAMGNFTINLASGNHGTVAFDFLGCWGGVTDATILDPTEPTTLPPRFASGTLTRGGVALLTSNVTISSGNTLELRPDAATASGYAACAITARNATVTMDPEDDLVATRDDYGSLLAGTEAALSIVVGASANNTMTIAAPKLQFTGITPGDRNGILVNQATYQCNRSASTGNDDLTIAFT